ncbi:MAG: SIS domain-containing protein [Lachnospiraceae bacterium]|nr:SIS domain-containing protein [Lachnospiraceae bacterium]
MYLTEKEIMSQHEALIRTYDYIKENSGAIMDFFKKNNSRKFVFLGCGSSYMLAKSAQRVFAACPQTSAAAIAGGDYLVNPEYYKETVKDAVIVTLSRSGQTSEIVRDVKYIKENFGNPVISISMKADNGIMPYSDLDITLDWCYDKSVCQTRTVTNLYASILLLVSLYSGDDQLTEAVKAAVEQNEEYKNACRPILEKIAEKDWDNAIILADGALIGIAEEGALAFTEISMLSGKCFNLLDYRHGPMVLNDAKTLTIVAVQPGEDKLQRDMIEDLKTHKGTMITVSAQPGNPYGVDEHICLEGISRFEAWGIPFIFVMQMIAYAKSILLDRNPDAPTGLDAFITL